MNLIIKKRQIALMTLLFVLSGVMLIQGCGTSGSRECDEAPFGSTISINPTSISWASLSAPTTDTWKVTVLYPDGTPMPYACLNIFGSLAAPRVPARYQFQDGAAWAAHTPVNSGFKARTDVSGQYMFSTLISDVTVTWTDTIHVESGANEVGADYKLGS